MSKVSTRIAVTGFTGDEVSRGLPDLLEEFGRRPWLLAYDARWAADGNKLVVTVESEGDSLKIQGGTTGAHLDEVWDCVIACFQFTSDGSHFDVEEPTLVGGDGGTGPAKDM